VLRLLAAAPAAWLILARRYGEAFPLVWIAGWTDYFDGYLARRFGWMSRTGAWMDPLADKALMSAIFASLAWNGEIPVWFAALVLGRDLMILAMAGYAVAFTSLRDFPPSLWGKVSTAIQILVAALYLMNLAGVLGGLEFWCRAALWASTAMTAWSGAHYFYTAICKLRSLQA